MFCAYHSQAPNGLEYANMPFPIYQSATGSRAAATPAEISPTSHETVQGPTGHFFNQVINGHNYLTQEEFNNARFFASDGGCLQHP